jgi:hypothetical protein
LTNKLTITHTHAEGTLVDGTSKGDGSAPILKANRFRWGRSIATWYLPHSRDQLSKDWIINTTKAALEAAGFEVEVTIDNAATRSVEEREADKAERAESRSEMLSERADRHNAIADGADVARRRISDSIPLGQPILVGHHSEGRHRRDLDRIDGLMRKSVEHSHVAQDAQRRSDNLAQATELRHTPHAVGARIERLETELRRVIRGIEGSQHTFGGGYVEKTPAATGEYLARLTIERTGLEGDLVYWRRIRDELLEAGAPDYSPDTISKGDYVKVIGIWYEVARVNKKTVSVVQEFGGWKGTRTTPYHKITDHRTHEQIAAAKAEKVAQNNG